MVRYFVILFLLIPTLAWGQKIDGKFISGTLGASTLPLGLGAATPSAGQILIGNAGGTAYAAQTMSGSCTITSAGVTSCSGGGGSSAFPVPTGYTGPTIRTTSGSSVAPVIMQPSSGGGTATLTFNATSQGNCQANDEMVFYLANDSGTIVNASGTHLDSTSFSNGRSETWHQTWAASTSVVFTDAGNHIWWGIGICVIPGSRGHPVLVDQHVLSSASQSSNYQYSVNSSPITPTQSQALHLIFATQTCNASCSANNQIFLNSPTGDDVASTNGEAWSMFTIAQNIVSAGGGFGIWGSFRTTTDRDPNFNWAYIGSSSGGSGNDQFAVIDVY